MNPLVCVENEGISFLPRVEVTFMYVEEVQNVLYDVVVILVSKVYPVKVESGFNEKVLSLLEN